MTTTDRPVSAHLPRAAREALVAASKTPIPDSDPLARIKAIEQTTKRVKQQHPNYFLKD